MGRRGRPGPFRNGTGRLISMVLTHERAGETGEGEFRMHLPLREAIFLEDAEKSLAIYRVAQEAVRNAVQHIDARKIRIILQKMRGNVMLQVKDDGEGFTVREEETASEMAVMQYRAAAVGGGG